MTNADVERLHKLCLYCGSPRRGSNRIICGTNRDCYRKMVRDRMRKTLEKHGGNIQHFIKAPSWTKTDEGRKKLREIAIKQGRNWPFRGGRGTPIPKPQKMLADALGWPTEVVVKTGLRNGNGSKSSYAIDIANSTRKIAVEVDGPSHRRPKSRAEDFKKESWLTSNGWTVLRFKNEQVLSDLSYCVSKVVSLL